MAVILDRIVAGEYAVGDRLPREVDLQHELGVSRGVVRETLRALEERGVAVVRHGVGGATVAPIRDWDVFDREVLHALVGGPQRGAFLAELVECRSVVEVEAARLAASRRDRGALTRLEAAVERLARSPVRGYQARGLAELDFHRELVAAAGNEPAAKLVAPMLDAMTVLAEELGRRRESEREHGRILSAVAGSDGPAAADAMRDHLRALAAALSRRQRGGPRRAGVPG